MAFFFRAFGDLKPTEDFVTVKSDQSIVPREREREEGGLHCTGLEGTGLFVVRSNYSNTLHPQ